MRKILHSNGDGGKEFGVTVALITEEDGSFSDLSLQTGEGGWLVNEDNAHKILEGLADVFGYNLVPKNSLPEKVEVEKSQQELSFPMETIYLDEEGEGVKNNWGILVQSSMHFGVNIIANRGFDGQGWFLDEEDVVELVKRLLVWISQEEY